MSHGHKVAALSFTMALALAEVMGLLWLLGGGAPSVHADSPHYVASNCAGIPAPCHTTIQEAVDAASPGDVILVATGVYTDVHGLLAPPGYPAPPASGVITQVVYISKTVTIRGGYTTAFTDPPDPEANPTTLDAQGQGRVLYITGNISPTIEGLHITNGDATGLGSVWGTDTGGGVYVINATVTISNNRMFSNTAQYGGGLYLHDSDATLSGNTFTDNKDSAHAFLLTLRAKGYHPRVIVTDLRQDYSSLIAQVFPKAQHHPCIFHALQNVRSLQGRLRCRLRRDLSSG
jgi:parallel beta-helix repeat protein